MPGIHPAKRVAILADLRNETGSLRAIATKHGVGASTLSRLAKAEGINPAARTQTKKATEAARVDSEAARVEQAIRARTFSARILASLNRMTDDQWAKVSPLDRARIYGITVDKAAVLERGTAPDDGGAAVLVRDLVAGLRATAAQSG